MPLVGDCVIDEELAGVRLSIGPESFFQINPEAAEKMFAQLSSWVTGGRVLELFAGVGALSVLLAPVVSELVTVENNEASVELAKATMGRLGHSHVRCHCDDAYDVSEFLSAGHSFDAVVVDPPGKGLGPELIKTLVDSDIREVLMLACRANALRRDLPLLIGGGFSIAEASLVDQFPRTGQFETMLKLVR
jgi:23S rRNA (uracil1939-C5)-methyltransferase